MDHNHRSSIGLLATLAVSAVVIAFFEWHTDEPLVVLPVLLFMCFVAAVVFPAQRVLIGALLGWLILAAHAVSSIAGSMMPRYETHPPLIEDWVTMSLLVLPALAASFAGSVLRRTIAVPTQFRH